jgi:bifunctional non-homologous end joining protein LigD
MRQRNHPATSRDAGGRLAYPRNLWPMLATLIERPFDSPRHLFEVKWDGVRTLAFIEDGKVRLQARSLNDTTHQFPELRAIAGQLNGRRAILDGEVVCFTPEGKPSFNRLQNRLNVREGIKPAMLADKFPVNFQAFDILYLDDEDLLERPLIERKQVLRESFASGDFAQVSDFILERGADYYEAIAAMGLEGMLAKETASPYLPGKRTRHWLKIKVSRSADFVVGGYTFGMGHREHSFGALLLGLYDEDGGLRWVGQVGGGFSDKKLAELMPLLEAHHTRESPFANPPKVDKFSYWCDPAIVCKVRYAEMTDAGKLRFPIFEEIRPDVPPVDCTLLSVRPEEISL